MITWDDWEARPWEDRILNAEKRDTVAAKFSDEDAALNAWADEPGVYLTLDEGVVEESAFSTTVNGSERMFSVGTVTRNRSPSGVGS
jgi:hypothetical protein